MNIHVIYKNILKYDAVFDYSNKRHLCHLICHVLSNWYISKPGDPRTWTLTGVSHLLNANLCIQFDGRQANISPEFDWNIQTGNPKDDMTSKAIYDLDLGP